MSITVNDLLDLMALHDRVTITSDRTGDILYDGIVWEVPIVVRAMKPCTLASYSNEYVGNDATIQIEVDE